MTDLTIPPRKRIGRAASRIFGTTPLAWLICAALPVAVAANAGVTAASPADLEVWLVPAVVTISLLAMWASFYAAGAIGRWGRVFWSAASIGVGLGIALTSYQSGSPGEHNLPFLAVPVALVCLTPLFGPSRTNQPYGPRVNVWTLGSRLLVKMAPLGLSCLGLSLLAGLVASVTVDTWAWLAAIGTFFATLLCTLIGAMLGAFSHSVSDPQSFDAPLNSVELQLTKMGFTFASLATVAACAGLYVARAFASGQVLTTSQLELQTWLLTGLALVGPVALFLGAPFVDGNSRVRGRHMHRLGRVMRLFPPAFVVLFAWSGPAVLTDWAAAGWTDLEQFGVCILGAGTAFCLLRTVFDLLGMRLPLWVLPTTYAAATLGAGVMAL